jgi:hypothetical protein
VAESLDYQTPRSDANGSYPPTVQATVPTYIRTIPPAERARWAYGKTSDGNGYWLSFEGGTQDAVGFYSSEGRYWSIDTK